MYLLDGSSCNDKFLALIVNYLAIPVLDSLDSFGSFTLKIVTFKNSVCSLHAFTQKLITKIIC